MSKEFDPKANSVILYGEVLSLPEYSHVFDDVSYYIIRMRTQRFKNHNEEEIIQSDVRVFLKEDDVTGNMKVGDYCKITGKLVMSKIKGIKDISVVENSIEYLDNIDDPKMSSSIDVSGIVTHVFTNKENYKGFVNFVIAQTEQLKDDPTKTKKLMSVRILIWGKLAQHVLDTIKIGNEVNVKGYFNNVTGHSKEDDSDYVISEIYGTVFSQK